MDKVGPRCATGDDSPSFGTSERVRQRLKNPGILTVGPTPFCMEAASRPAATSFMTLSDSDWAGDAGRRSVSGVS